jgi:hypothetical protein
MSFATTTKLFMESSSRIINLESLLFMGFMNVIRGKMAVNKHLSITICGSRVIERILSMAINAVKKVNVFKIITITIHIHIPISILITIIIITLIFIIFILSAI